MNNKKYGFLNFLVLSFFIHLLFAVGLVALIPKMETYTTIELQSGAIGVKSMGVSGPGKELKKVAAKPATIPPTKSFTDSQQTSVSKVALPSEASGGESLSGSGEVGSRGSGTGLSGEGRGSGKDTPLSRYVQKVVTLIEDHKNYPSRARTLGQQGTVSLKIKLNHEGRVLEMDIIEAPPYKILVKAAEDTITEIGNFPPMPAEVTLETLTMNVPIRYELVE